MADGGIIKLVSEIYRELGLSVPVMDVYRFPTVRRLATNVLTSSGGVVEAEYISFNPSGNGRLFCFPPAVGYGLVYRELAHLIGDVAVYAFNFIESEDRLERYIKTIMEVQPEGAVMLLGYSAGGYLSLKVASLLEEMGREVGGVILLDCLNRSNRLKGDETVSQEVLDTQWQEMDDIVGRQLAVLGLENMKESQMERMKLYSGYTERLDGDGFAVLAGDIHLILAGNRAPADETNGWNDICKGDYRVLNGFGEHREMLRTGFLEKNADIVSKIISEILSEKRIQKHGGGGILL